MTKEETKYLTERETKILESFPVLSQEDVDGCNDLFRRYIIYQTEKDGRRVWTSCCHKNGELLPFLERLETPEREKAKYARHNEYIRCPFCGKYATVKCRGKFKGWRATYERVPVVFLHTAEDGSIYAQAYIAVKRYGEDPSGYPQIGFDSAYYFYPSGGIMFWKGWGSYYCEEERGKIGSKKKCAEPFGHGGYGGHEHYKVIYIERLESSFAKWCNYRAWVNLDAPGAVWCDDLMRWLLAAAIYPRQLEMLIRTGQRGLINELLWESKKNVKVFDWSQTDPRRAFGMTKRELSEYFGDHVGLDGLYARKLLGCSYHEAREWITGLDALPVHMLERLVKEAGEHAIEPKELRKYLLRFTGPRCHGGWFGLQQAQELWEGYLRNAETAGYDLQNRDRLMPRDLYTEHDEAAAIVQRMREAEDAKKRAKQNKAARNREKALNRKYGFETEHYLIRAPHNAAEIIAEGKKLQHCVGGYANRHAEGTATILFLRDKAHPHTPLCTIEVNGNRLVQIHGFKNERDAGSVKPEIRFAEIYKPWKKWLDAGTPRNEDGTPKVPRKKGAKTA